MTARIRSSNDDAEQFGVLEGDAITVYRGDIFEEPQATDQVVSLNSVSILPPTRPTKMIGLWNKFHAAAE